MCFGLCFRSSELQSLSSPDSQLESGENSPGDHHSVSQENLTTLTSVTTNGTTDGEYSFPLV